MSVFFIIKLREYIHSQCVMITLQHGSWNLVFGNIKAWHCDRFYCVDKYLPSL